MVRTPAPKRSKLAVESDEEEEDEPSPVKLGKHGEQLAPCGRPSFRANKVNKKYNSRYRNSENKNKLGGNNKITYCSVDELFFLS